MLHQYVIFFYNLAQIAIQKNKRLYAGVTVGKEYMVRFKVLATKFVGAEWINVLHFYNDEKYKNHGNRIPAVYFKETAGTRRLYVFTQSTDTVVAIFTATDILDGVWTDVLIQQVERAGRYVIEVVVNGDMIGSIVNADPYVFENVKVYASNKWSPAQTGFMKDFSFK